MLGIITGLTDEADLLVDPPQTVRVRCDGMGPKRARDAACALVKEGCGGLISFGIAGGLDAHLRPGTVVLADRVLDDRGGSWATDEEWRERLYAQVRKNVRTVEGTLTGSGHVVTTPLAKRQLEKKTGAVAVDMESDAVARVAEEAGLPFLVVRAISDPAWTTIPRVALKGVDAAGRRQVWAVVRALARRPSDLPGLLRLRMDSGKAMKALGRVTAWTDGTFAFR